MTVYTKSQSEDIFWPEKIERVYQSLPSGPATELAPKLRHLSDWEALFVGTLPLIPRESRPHGLITWASKAFAVSRTSVYALGQRIQERILTSEAPNQPDLSGMAPAGPAPTDEGAWIEVTPERIKRTILAAAFPGNVSIRPTQVVVQEALGQRPSVGFVSELRLEAGRRAGRVLAGLDYSGIGEVIVGRDETFFTDFPILFVVEPVSATVLLALACQDRQAETWAAALELVQEQGVSIKGLVEDMARNFEKSQKLAGLATVTVQKDTWHLTRDGGQVQRDLERSAYRAMGIVLELERKLNKAWDDPLFAHYVDAVAKEEWAITQHDAYAELFPHLCDALNMVDWRSGEIRDRQTADWLLTETLALMTPLTDKRIQRFVTTVRNHQPHLLTCLDWIADALPDWQTRLANVLPLAADAAVFQRTAARHWCLQQKLINGHKQWGDLAAESGLALDLWIEAYPPLAAYASELSHILDSAGHTNSITECINGIFKSFLESRQAFRNLETLQAYLDLFVLWYNMHPFQRGKRQGKSPFQIAGIQTDLDDWLALLGF